MHLNYILPILVLGIVLLLSWLGWKFFLGQPRILEGNRSPKPVLTGAEALGALAAGRPEKRNEKPAVSAAFLRASRRVPSVAARYWRVWLPVVSLLLVALAVAITLKLNRFHRSPEFEVSEYAQGMRIKQTLLEEKLVPPPPLPPEAFVNVIAERPSLGHADRDWSKLNPEFVQVVLRVMERMKARGFPMVLLEGYRSPERQDSLAGQATLVTKAKGGQSKHQYGLAVDLAPIREGKVVISERDPWAMQAYNALGEEATAAGLTWGGNWSFKDFGHIERSGSLKSLLKK
ncbi:M15 family metallopeptidase [Chromobacterium haemolyticum]|uniref:M15 family metallopeptidase n=1 Tax=Chromobacterium haemolyticum TaxID=394935 RepID=UPI001F080E33|nr:M15 family metallopeptidase [Chromobacterium haemolyticum]